jgi:23S rRNA pseudouridine955/2504/2580 synthase
MELKTGADDGNRRLDRILRKALPGYPLSALHRLLRQGRVLVDGRPAAPGDRIRAGAVISVPGIAPVPRHRFPPPVSPGLAVLWQGAGLIILNKSAGMAVHGPGGMDALVRAYLAAVLSPSLSFRPGPLHRLDKPTSGIIVFSTGLEGARRFSALLRERRLIKSYLALAEGRLETGDVWRDDLVRDTDAKKSFTGAARRGGGDSQSRPALTRVRPLAANAAYTLLLAEIETGRTHQIRAQAAARGHPLAGDIKYGGRPLDGGERGRHGGGFFLHAWKLELRETPPLSGADALPPFPGPITAPAPGAFRERVRALFGDDAAGLISGG